MIKTLSKIHSLLTACASVIYNDKKRYLYNYAPYILLITYMQSGTAYGQIEDVITDRRWLLSLIFTGIGLFSISCFYLYQRMHLKTKKLARDGDKFRNHIQLLNNAIKQSNTTDKVIVIVDKNSQDIFVYGRCSNLPNYILVNKRILNFNSWLPTQEAKRVNQLIHNNSTVAIRVKTRENKDIVITREINNFGSILYFESVNHSFRFSNKVGGYSDIIEKVESLISINTPAFIINDRITIGNNELIKLLSLSDISLPYILKQQFEVDQKLLVFPTILIEELQVVFQNSGYELKQSNIAGQKRYLVIKYKYSTDNGKKNDQVITETIEHSSEAISIFDNNQKLIMFNKNYSDFWGLDTKFLQQQPLESEILDTLYEKDKLPIAYSYNKWKKEHLEWYKKDKLYEDLWHLPGQNIINIKSIKNTLGGRTYIFFNQTKILNLESRYKEISKVQKETLDQLSSSVALFQPNGCLRLYNKSFVNMWGFDISYLDEKPHVSAIVARALADQAKNTSNENFINPNNITKAEDKTGLVFHFGRILRYLTTLSDRRQTFSGRFELYDGRINDYSIVPLPDGSTLLAFNDITASARSEAILKEKNEALLAADKLKDTFLKHVSYELRTPLTNIIGFSGILASSKIGTLNKLQSQYTNYIQSSSRELLSLIDNIIDIASIQAGSLTLELNTVNIENIVTNALHRLEEKLKNHDCEIKKDLSKLPSSFKADSDRLQQILYNLISNAMASSKGKMKIKISCWQNKNHIFISVADDGLGIPEKVLDDVWDKFSSFSTQEERRAGTGLGLSLVRSLVELHGGNVVIDSKEGNGTIVTCSFPIEKNITKTINNFVKYPILNQG